MRQRIAGMAGILAGLTAVQIVIPQWFPIVVIVLLIGAPAVNWLAVWRLRNVHRRAKDIRSAQTAYYGAMFLAVASTAIAAVVLAGRIPILPVGREVLLIGFAFGLLLMTGPAFDWLQTFDD